MGRNAQDPAPPTGDEAVSDDLRARAVAFNRQAADIHAILMPFAKDRGVTVLHYARLDDGGLVITTDDGATTTVDAARAAEARATWTTEDRVASAIKLVKVEEADRHRVRLARKLGRETAAVTEFYRDNAGVKRTRLKAITLAPRRPVASRSTGRAARQATNHRSAGSRRTAASSSTAGSDPGEGEGEGDEGEGDDPPPAARPDLVIARTGARYIFGAVA